MKLSLVAALLPLAACGRTGFDVVPDAPPAVLACASVPQVQLPPGTQFLSATATATGYAMFATDANHQVSGIPVSLSDADPSHTPIVGATVPAVAQQALGQIGAFASGDDLELAVPYHEGPFDPSAPPPAQGTRLVPLTAQLAPRGAASVLGGWFGERGAVAYNSHGVAVNVLEQADHTIAASTAASAGAAWSAPTELIPATAKADMPMIVAADDQFLVSWLSSDGNLFAQVFDADPVNGLKPTSLSATLISQITDKSVQAAPRVAYGHGMFLFVWYTKPSNDVAWYSLRSKSLQVIREDKVTLADANHPVVAAGDQDFLVAWSGGDGVGAARIGFDGTATQVKIVNAGGVPLTTSWNVVSHNGQPALIWAEQTQNNTIAWINPACVPGAAAAP
ncbi:MAG TPA: hypothetical protein VFP84_36740 [Kofleriaceae bacterium]|nr:hypothetical protein [Kofleriaceae bacterium]